MSQFQGNALVSAVMQCLCVVVVTTLSVWGGPAFGQPTALPIKSRVNANGLVADLYLPEGAASVPAIIVLGGSEGGLGRGAAQEAQLVSEHGYAVLHLAYFGTLGLRAKLELIPLEYFKKAIDWLRSQPSIDPREIGIIGTSVGAEAALRIAAQYPEIKAVVAAAPSSVIWPGIDMTGRQAQASFTLANKPLSDLPYGWSGSFKGVYALYADGLKDLDEHRDAIIPVERINGPVLLVCGAADSLWPSCAMAHQIEARLRTKEFKHKVQVLKYEDAGHGVFGPPEQASGAKLRMLGSLGGSAEGNNAARTEAWPLALSFMDSALKP
ncbi:MAG: acyl-CoA thioester hydrolase/BAAT C-terminal domain-containing protein [Bryocella sp.]